jgi:hypothetical protein
MKKMLEYKGDPSELTEAEHILYSVHIFPIPNQEGVVDVISLLSSSRKSPE